ncbi:MAG: acyl-CoA dehydrogenase [Dehalobacter sp. 4CP]|uniref:acyl-CoA dehydrogenase family protein n=1 Tax=Dehalobacter sp. CP TaxID=2594474 RepID=UPI0013C812D8|nr:acyl-CoA dehydrogenase [Dehalobacter sp. 4CP]
MSDLHGAMPGIATGGEGYGYTEEEWLLKKNVRQFCEEFIDPRFRESFKAETADPLLKEFIKKFGDKGYLRINVPEELGGYGQRLTAQTIILEEVARVNGGLAIHTGENGGFALLLAIEVPAAFAKWGEALLSGELIIADAENSPEGQCNYSEHADIGRLEGDEWVLNGTKAFSSGASFCDVLMVTGLVDGDMHRWAMDAKNTPGLKITPAPEMGNSPMYGTIELNNVRVPKEFGAKTGTVINRKKVDAVPSGKGNAVGTAALSMGAMGAAFDKTVEYLKHRTTNFQPLASLGSIQYKLALMKCKIEASRSFLIAATRMIETNHKDAVLYASLAKAYICDTAREITSDCIQLWGCAGYNPDTGIERYLRDAVGFGIGVCTSEMQLATAAKYMGLPGAEFECV